MATFKARTPPTFNPNINNFTSFSEWREEFVTYCTVTKFFTDQVELPIQRAQLFNIAGPEFMRFTNQLITIAADTTITQILDAISTALKPKRLDLQNRGKLFAYTQSTGMSAMQYLHELRKLYKLTNYPEQVDRETLLRDLFISGISSPDARRLLFQEDSDNLSLDRCIHLVSSFETAEMQPVLERPPAEASVSAITKNFSRPRQCDGCGQQPSQHTRQHCPAYRFKCHSCGKLGHFSKVCRVRKPVSNTITHVKDDSSYDINSTNVATVSAHGKSKRKMLRVAINGKEEISMLIDSGSDVTLIDVNSAKQLKLSFKPPSTPVPKCLGADGSLIKMAGIITNACLETPNGYIVDNIWVAEQLTSRAIIGQSSLSAFEAITFRYGGHLPPLTVNEVTANHEAVESGFTTHPPVKCFAHVQSKLKPIRAPARRQRLDDKLFIQSEIKRLQEEGKIRPSNSSWRSQVFVVRENNRKPRMVVDYSQTINRETPLDAYPIPLVTEVLDQASQYKVFSYIDLKAAYHQFRIDPAEGHFTAFEANGQLWEFTCIPFGLRNSPAAFNRALHDIIGKVPGLIMYADDVVIGGRDYEEHDKNLQAFMSCAQEANLKFSQEKCTFRGTSLRFLGLLIKNGTMSPDPDRSAPFVNFPIPTTFKQLERFIGLAVYHAKWVPNFSKTMDPLFCALQEKSLPLGKSALDAIRQVKQGIKTAILYIVDPDKPLCLSTDASGTAIGAVLSQDGQPVAFMSRRLTPAQRRWSAAETEGFAVISACQQFRNYLLGKSFSIFCDQHGFVQALNTTSAKQIKNAKFARWRLELSEFDFKIQHLPGILNTAADALTRGTSVVSMDHSSQLAQLRHTQYGHPGIKRLCQLLKMTGESSTMSNVEEVCKKVTTTCRICSQIKPRWIKPLELHVIKSTAPWQRISVDFMTNKPNSEGYCNVLTVIDEYSRFPFAFATKDRLSTTVIERLTQLFTLYGPPSSVHSDRGAEFLSAEMVAFLAKWGVQQSRTTPYNPACNGQTERYNGTIWKTVQCILAEHELPDSAWPKVLGEALHCVRSLINTTTQETPHDRFCKFSRKVCPGTTSPIAAGNFAWLRRHVRNKNDPSGDVVQVVATYPGYAVISRDGKSMDTVNWRHLAPHPGPASDTSSKLTPTAAPVLSGLQDNVPTNLSSLLEEQVDKPEGQAAEPAEPVSPSATPVQADPTPNPEQVVEQSTYTTRYGRVVKKPDWLIPSNQGE